VLSEDNSVNEQSLESNETNQPKEMEKGSVEKRKLRFSSHDAAEERKEKSSKQEKRERKDGKKNEWDMFAEADTMEEHNVGFSSLLETLSLILFMKVVQMNCVCAPSALTHPQKSPRGWKQISKLQLCCDSNSDPGSCSPVHLPCCS
jgi:hypothetical protein